MKMAESKYDKFLNTYSGEKLLEKHSLDEEGVWRILGEDPNCDFGGHHYRPELDIVTGCLRDVIAYAVELPDFWQWGAGGGIIKQPMPKKITAFNNREREKDLAAIYRMEEEIRKLKLKHGVLRG